MRIADRIMNWTKCQALDFSARRISGLDSLPLKGSIVTFVLTEELPEGGSAKATIMFPESGYTIADVTVTDLAGIGFYGPIGATGIAYRYYPQEKVEDFTTEWLTQSYVPKSTDFKHMIINLRC